MRGRPSARQSNDRARDLMRDLQRALRRESWGQNVLQLAWTAGPVTYLALQGGYLLGYGRTAPGELFVYFGAYTIIAGFAAIFVRLIYQATKGRQAERDTQTLRDCLDRLPRLLLHARDVALTACNEEDARLLAAKHLLANPDASEPAVVTAVQDLGGSNDMAAAVQRIEVYRRNGMPSRIPVERSRVEAELARLGQALESKSPDTARLLHERMHGRAPGKRQGRLRTEGFIERALAAESEDDEHLMSLVDVEEIVTFTIEMLVGRHLPQITFYFVGDRVVGNAWNELERARREFRSRLRSRNSRLRITAEHLSERMEGVVTSMARMQHLPQLRDQIVAAIDAWTAECDDPARPRLSRSSLEALRRTVASYRYLEQADSSLHRSHQRMVAAMERYRDAVRQRSSGARPTIGFADEKSSRLSSAVRIREGEIGLEERSRVALARSVRTILERRELWDDWPIRPDEHMVLAVSVEILAAIEDHIPLYRPEVQQAVELCRAPTIEALEPGLSADVRAGWTAALVDEVEENLPEYALRRVEQLVRFHAMHLSDAACSRIAERFRIDVEMLRRLDREVATTETPWSRRPMQIPRRAHELRRVVERAGAPRGRSNRSR